MSTTSVNNILQQAYEYVSEDDIFLRLTTISTIVHSMIFVVVVAYNITYAMSKVKYERSSTIIKEVSSIIKQLLEIDGLFFWWVIVALVLAVWYYILPPIGEAAMIYHLEKSHNNKSGSSFSHWLSKFFVMFERNSLLWFISVSTWLIIISRLWILDIINEPLVIAIVAIYSIVVITTVALTPYVKFKLVVEQEKFATAIKESILLALSQPIITLRLVLVWLILNLRIIFNIIVLVGVPAMIFYIAYILNLHQTTVFYIILSVVIIALFLLIAYINSIVEAFFMTYWYLWYRTIEPQSQP
jgi:hypothetical protein